MLSHVVPSWKWCFFSLISLKRDIQHYEMQSTGRKLPFQFSHSFSHACIQSIWFFSNIVSLSNSSGNQRVIPIVYIVLGTSESFLASNSRRRFGLQAIFCLMRAWIIDISHCSWLILFPVYFCLFWDWVSYSSGMPWIHYADKAGLKFLILQTHSKHWDNRGLAPCPA